MEPTTDDQHRDLRADADCPVCGRNEVLKVDGGLECNLCGAVVKTAPAKPKPASKPKPKPNPRRKPAGKKASPAKRKPAAKKSSPAKSPTPKKEG